MENNKKEYAEAIAWIVYIVTTIVFRFSMANDVPLSAYAAFFSILCILLWISLYKHRYELLGIKYNFALGVAFTLNVINLLVGIVLDKCYPGILEENNTLGGIISSFFFFLLVGVIVVGTEKKKNKRNQSK